MALSQGPWTKKGLPWCPKPRAVRTGPGPEMTSGSLRSLVDSPRAGSSGSGGPAAAGEGRSGLDRGRRGEPAGLARAIRRLCQLPRRRGRGPGLPGLPGPDLGALVAIKARCDPTNLFRLNQNIYRQPFVLGSKGRRAICPAREPHGGFCRTSVGPKKGIPGERSRASVWPGSPEPNSSTASTVIERLPPIRQTSRPLRGHRDPWPPVTSGCDDHF